MLFGPIGADARHGGYQYRNSDGTVAFSPDGSRLATVKGNAVLLWDLSGIPTGNGFKVAQARLPWKNGEPDCNLSTAVGVENLSVDEPICGDAYDPPSP